MKKIQENIYTFLRRNNIIVYFFGLMSFLISFCSLFFAYTVYENSKNVIYTYSSKGEIVPLKLLSLKENRVEQVKANLELFVGYFYNLDQYNYEKQLNKSLWLSGQKVTNIYKQKQAEGYYNQFIQFGIVQSAELLKVTVLNLDEPYIFRAEIKLILNNNGNRVAYLIHIEGDMLDVSINYPKNPFGLLINNYVEKSIVKIKLES